jgi:putative transposase
MKFNPNHHHRRSIRLPGYDYSQPGAYFVTICTHQRECTFGTVQDQTVFLSLPGKIVEQCWRSLPRHFVFIELSTFVVMPNHLHGVVIIKNYDQRVVAQSSGTTPRSLGSVIQNFKSISTRKIKQEVKNERTPIWQRGYYERIIRDEAELDRIHRYIEANPERWSNNA